MPSPAATIKETQRRYRERNRDAIRARKRAAYNADPEKHQARTGRYRRENRDAVYAYNRIYRKAYYGALRKEMIAAYGGACACCGEAQPLFLHLDHVHGGGNAHRAEVGNSQTLLKWLKDRGWPKDAYRLLCANCNHGRAINGGVCPHETRR